MRKINMQTWPRRQHFEFFNTFDSPHFGMCANVDLTAFYPFMKQHEYSINLGIIYLITRAVNTIPEFRYRIRAGEVVEHEIIHPAATILTKDDLFNFSIFDYAENFSTFAARADQRITEIQADPALKDEPGREQLNLYDSHTLGVVYQIYASDAFTSIRFDAQVRMGKFFEAGNLLMMPLDVQAHHALMDGIHMGIFFEKLQGYLHNPGSVLGVAS